MSLTTVRSFKDGFNKQGTPILVGYVYNKQWSITNLPQGLLTAPDKTVLPGYPVKIVNSVGATPSTNTLAGMNSDGLQITGIATTVADIGGFLLKGQTDVALFDGSVAYPQTGMMNEIGLFGSGIITFLACDTSLSNVPVNTLVTWDATNLVLKATTATAGDALPIDLIGARVEAAVLAKNTVSGLIEWTNGFAVKVRL